MAPVPVGALTNVSFAVPRGAAWALVGPNGAGKSTLATLITRLRDVGDGAVRVLGVDVRDVRQGDLRRVVVALGQHAGLFNRSIRDNLVMGCPPNGVCVCARICVCMCVCCVCVCCVCAA